MSGVPPFPYVSERPGGPRNIVSFIFLIGIEPLPRMIVPLSKSMIHRPTKRILVLSK